jgi:hypothetical protein
MKKFFRRIIRAFWPEHILYVTHRGKERIIHVKEFKKLGPKRIKGVKKTGEEFELVSIEPMDYYIVEYRDDLI